MDARLRTWARLPYLDSERILRGLRDIAANSPLHELPYEVASLRRRELRAYAEGRQAALFCYGMSQIIGTSVWFAQAEASDYDVVARYVLDDLIHYAPVQLKEFVPEHVNPTAELQVEMDKIGKYVDSAELVVAFHINRAITLHPSELRLPGGIGGLWLYGAKSSDQSRWFVIGNPLAPQPGTLEFGYPGA